MTENEMACFVALLFSCWSYLIIKLFNFLFKYLIKYIKQNYNINV